MSADWSEMQLGDFLELKRGYDLPQKNREEGSIPVVSSSGISGLHNAAKVQAPGVVTGRYGTIGEVFYVEEDFWPLNTTLYVKDFKGNDPLFVYYFLKTINYLDYSDKAAVPGVNRNHLHTAKITVPNRLDEQQKIAHVLWAFDKKIELNRQINQTLEEMAQAIFKSWFVDFEPVKAKIEAKANGQDPERAAMCAISGKTDAELDQLSPDHLAQLRTTAALFPDELTDSELGSIPKGWLPASLGNFVNFQNGYAFKSKDWKETGFPVVKIGSVKPGFVDIDSCSYVSEDTVKGLDRFILLPGDILIGMTGYPGETGLVPHCGTKVYLNQRVGKLGVENGNHGFVFCVVRNERFKPFVESQSHGSAQANVSAKAILSFPVIDPESNLIAYVEQIVQPSIQQMLLLENEIRALSQLRDTLLPKLLSGEIDLSQVA